MKPVYARGDGVLYRKATANDLETGDIVVFSKGNTVVTHRVYSITRKGDSVVIQTKGDANNAPDGFSVYESDVLGIVEYRIKYIGFPTVWLNDLFDRRENND